MSDSILVEEPNEETGLGKSLSLLKVIYGFTIAFIFILERPFGSCSSVTTEQNTSYQGRDFKVVVDSKLLETPVSFQYFLITSLKC